VVLRETSLSQRCRDACCSKVNAIRLTGYVVILQLKVTGCIFTVLDSGRSG
jgi:hypothetical protein